jgi:hypothetical protein
MGKIAWLVIVLFVGLCLYTLLSVFAPTGEVDTVSGVVFSVSSGRFWLAGTQGFARVSTTKDKCFSVPEGVVQKQDWVEVRAKVTDSFQMSICDAADGYVKAHDTVYPKQIVNELAP